MVNKTYEEIVQKISESTSLSMQDIEAKIQKKIIELQDLISKEGAAHIIANEFGIKLYDSIPKKLKVEDVIPGMNAITLTAKLINLYPVREFQSKDRKGKVASMLVADETGSIRIVVWDENIISKISELSENDIIKIQNGYSKDNRGFKEIHLGNRSQLIINPENESIKEVKLEIKSARKNISDLKENEFAELLGTIVQVFEPRDYDSCPECSKKVFLEGENYICGAHGKIISQKNLILNIFFDDGTSSIRAVLFRDNAKALIRDNFENFEELKKDILGKQIIISGKTVKNEMFNRIEFIVNSIQEINPEELLKEIQK